MQFLAIDTNKNLKKFKYFLKKGLEGLEGSDTNFNEFRVQLSTYTIYSTNLDLFNLDNSVWNFDLLSLDDAFMELGLLQLGWFLQRT